MSQHDYNIANDTGAAVRADLNVALGAIVTHNSGSAEPGTLFARMVWLDTTLNLRKRRNAANSAWVVEDTLAESFVISRSSNTQLTQSDRGRTFIITASITQTFQAASTLGDGWFVYYRNASSGSVTLDPNGSETMDGGATVVLTPGETCRISCNGAAFFTTGRSTVPPGVMFDFAGTAVPSGYLGCDGAAVSRTTFAALFSAIGTTWGAGNGSTTFNVPNFQRRVAVGSGGSGTGTLGNAVGNTGGAETHTLSIDEMPSHNHSGSTENIKSSGGSGGNTSSMGGNEVQEAIGINIAFQGGNQSHNNMQPSAVVLKIIKT